MASCDTDIDSFQSIDGTIEVLPKYVDLMDTSMGEDSIYARTKDTLFHQFEDLQITEKEKAGFILEFMSSFTNDLSKTAMTIALSWSKDERDAAYALAKVKADTELSQANYEKAKEDICKTVAETALVCTQSTAASAASIRDNGSVLLYEIDDTGVETCKVKSLVNEGLKYEQIQQVRASAYQIFADTYRKSGVVELGTRQALNTHWTDDSEDQDGSGSDPDNNGEPKYIADLTTLKGVAGNDDGYTWQQQTNAERQRIAYEDSKLNHAANSSASMIGQMLANEIQVFDQDVCRWRAAVDQLLVKHPSTAEGFDPYNPSSCTS